MLNGLSNTSTTWCSAYIRHWGFAVTDLWKYKMNSFQVRTDFTIGSKDITNNPTGVCCLLFCLSKQLMMMDMNFWWFLKGLKHLYNIVVLFIIKLDIDRIIFDIRLAAFVLWGTKHVIPLVSAHSCVFYFDCCLPLSTSAVTRFLLLCLVSAISLPRCASRIWSLAWFIFIRWLRGLHPAGLQNPTEDNSQRSTSNFYEGIIEDRWSAGHVQRTLQLEDGPQ